MSLPGEDINFQGETEILIGTERKMTVVILVTYENLRNDFKRME